MTGTAATAWERVAAPGTDPARLARVVSRAAADQRGFARAWQRARREGLDPGAAVDAAAGSPVLDESPGLEAMRGWGAIGAVVAVAGDRAMPARVRAVEAEPPWLAMCGGGVDVAGPSVAIVGSRRATDYGRGMASWLARTAGEAGCRVVSGGAIGIDAAAHAGAETTSGGTTVVLGCGHGVPYPRPHAGPGRLFDRVLMADGAIVSEALPDEDPRPWRVRSRNRLIAALADLVVVVEGGARSGALVTATWAADYGIQVMAVPGDARAAGSAAPLQLLRDGAAVCAAPADLLAMLPSRAGDPQPHPATPSATGDDPSAPSDGGDEHLAASTLPPSAHRVLASAWPRPVSIAALAARADLPIGQVLAAVTAAQVAGVVTRDVDGLRLCRRPRS